MITLGIAVVLYLLGAAQMYDLIEEAELHAQEEGGYFPWHAKAGYILGWPLVVFYDLAMGTFVGTENGDE
ncbi:hypothetical protein [Xanthomonas phage DES1]|nr:hypothetical protein [Xanthomonas phage DES1]